MKIFKKSFKLPIPIASWALEKDNNLAVLRTFIWLKTHGRVSADGLAVGRYKRIAEGLKSTRQTINNHIKRLKQLGWINYDPRTKGWFCRSWEKIVGRTDFAQNIKPEGMRDCSSFPVCAIESKSTLKGYIGSLAIRSIVKSQEWARRAEKRPKKVTKVRPSCKGGSVSLIALSHRLGVSKSKTANVRKLAEREKLVTFERRRVKLEGYSRWDGEKLSALGKVFLPKHGCPVMEITPWMDVTELCPKFVRN